MTIYNTLLLDQTAWDLVLDANGNIAMASTPYSTAQDVASALRTFKGEPFYDTSLGVPYFQNVLGQSPPLSVVRGYFENEAQKVNGVAQLQAIISQDVSARKLTGQVNFIDENGAANGIHF